jgi:advillin
MGQRLNPEQVSLTTEAILEICDN